MEPLPIVKITKKNADAETYLCISQKMLNAISKKCLPISVSIEREKLYGEWGLVSAEHPGYRITILSDAGTEDMSTYADTLAAFLLDLIAEPRGGYYHSSKISY